MQRWISLFVLAVPTAAAGQIASDCSPCEVLSVEETMVIGGFASGRGYVGRPGDMVRLLDGRIVLNDRYNQNLLKVYDPQGTFLRAVGGRGKGPGEFETIVGLHAMPDGGLEVYDVSLNRITQYDADFHVEGTIPLSARGVYMTVLPDGERIMAGPLYSPRGAGLPLHLLDAGGALVRSFGADPPISDLRDYDLIARRIEVASDTSVWSAHRLRYLIEEWSVAGTLLRTIERRTDWFPPVDDAGFVSPDEPPNAYNQTIHVADDGLLWVVTHVPDPEWEQAIGERPDPYGRMRTSYDFDNPSTYFDSVIEVIDPERLQVVARVRTDHAIRGVIDDGLFYGYRLGPAAEPEIPIFEVERPSSVVP